MSAPASMELLLKRIDGEDEIQERRLAIHTDTEILIGRASKTEQKQLVPAVDNGWIRNPVISRHHAVLTLEPSGIKPGVVFIQDKKSSHGTYVNGENIQQNKHPLHNGDKIRFGSEVMRGEETFRPPVFSFEIRQNGHVSTYRLPEITVIEETNTGKTISVPEDSDVESEGDEDLLIGNSASSQAPMSSVNPGNLLGSQANPWDIDEPEMVPESELPRNTAEGQDDDASSESEISILYDDDDDDDDDDDQGIDQPLDTDEDEDAEDIYNDEESEIGDQAGEGIGESPNYTPKSPRYIPEEAEGYNGPSRDFTPPKYGSETGGYTDGPFAYSRHSWGTPHVHKFASAPQPWDLENGTQPSRVLVNHPVPAGAIIPQRFTIDPIEPIPTRMTEHISRVTTTRERLDDQRRTNGISIDSLIHLPPGGESNAAGTKRKADVMDFEEEETLPIASETAALPVNNDPSSMPVKTDVTTLPQTPESLHKEPIESPILDAVVPMNISTAVAIKAEPPRKKQKLRSLATKAAIFGAGVMVGSAGMLGGLMSLPDGFFQS